VTLLRASGLRIAIDGVIAVEAFDLETVGDRLLLVGDVSALTALFAGSSVRIVSGSLAIADAPFEAPRYDVAVALLDPPLPGDQTAMEYVTWRARLVSLGRGAEARAKDALERTGLTRGAGRPLASFAVPERRALQFAAACVGSPAVIVAEAPLRGLDAEASAFVLAALAGVTNGRGAIVTADRLIPGSPEMFLAKQASDLAYFIGGTLVTRGAPPVLLASGRRFGVTVRANADALRATLTARGVEVSGGPLRYAIAVPEGWTPTDVLIAADESGASVVEIGEL
jgi:ABC-2 type transport system ATP-binding protein